MKKEGQIDDIPRKFLKACAPYISQILADFFNACIEQGTFPKIFKLSKITPVFKKGAKNLIKNYQPISILTNITKLFESIIFNRLQAFLKMKIYSQRINTDLEKTEEPNWRFLT